MSKNQDLNNNITMDELVQLYPTVIYDMQSLCWFCERLYFASITT